MDPAYLYSTRIQKTFDEDNAEIIHKMKMELAKGKRFSIRLINYYKGLPVSYPGTVVAVERDVVDIDSIPQQVICMQEHRYTFMRSNIFKHDLYANVQYANARRNAIAVRKLCYVEIMAERRNYIRLELDKQLHAILTTRDGIVKGHLTELAINGACVKIEQASSLHVGDELTISFMLHNFHQNVDYNVKIPAQVVGFEGDSLARYCRLLTMPDKIVERVIAQYLFQRQIEILREIRDAAAIHHNGNSTA